jgi:hypothetical protein
VNFLSEVESTQVAVMVPDVLVDLQVALEVAAGGRAIVALVTRKRTRVGVCNNYTHTNSKQSNYGN